MKHKWAENYLAACLKDVHTNFDLWLHKKALMLIKGENK